MNRRNHLENLPHEEQTTIMNLCEAQPYHAVAEQLAKPRSEGGLGIKTSTAALCRFYANFQKDAALQMVIAQYGKTLQIRREQNPGATLVGILALVETRLLAALKEGKPVTELTEEFRTLSRLHKTYATDQKLRSTLGTTQATYRTYVREQAAAPDVDYIPTEELNDPWNPNREEEDFNHLSQEMIDIYNESDRLQQEEYEKFVREKTRLEQEAKLAAARAQAEASEAESRRERPRGMSDAAWVNLCSIRKAAQTPVIPKISVIEQLASTGLGRRNPLVHQRFPEILQFLTPAEKEAANPGQNKLAA